MSRNGTATKKLRAVIFACWVWVALGVMAVPVRGQQTTAPSASLPGISYVWHDGKVEHRIWLHPGLLAEFNGDPVGKERTPKQLSGAAKIVAAQGTVRVWRTTPPGVAGALAPKGEGLADENTSPVFFDNPAHVGAMRALPGRIVVQFKTGLSDDDAAAWARARGFGYVRSLRMGITYHVLQGTPGLKALEQANTLRAENDVLAAFPDWWQLRQTR